MIGSLRAATRIDANHQKIKTLSRRKFVTEALTFAAGFSARVVQSARLHPGGISGKAKALNRSLGGRRFPETAPDGVFPAKV